jgi:hypothetical protein
MNKRINSEKQKLDSLFKAISVIENEEMKSQWARYLCVSVSCFIDNALKNLLADYTSKLCHPNVQNFIDSRLSKLTNLKEETIFQLLGSFNPDWAKDFRKKLSDKQKNAFNSVVATRHKIVHGGSVNITYLRLKNYYKDIIASLEIIDNLIA